MYNSPKILDLYLAFLFIYNFNFSFFINKIVLWHRNKPTHRKWKIVPAQNRKIYVSEIKDAHFLKTTSFAVLILSSCFL